MCSGSPATTLMTMSRSVTMPIGNNLPPRVSQTTRLPTCDVRMRLAASTIISVFGATTTLRVQMSPTVMAFASTSTKLPFHNSTGK
jgi:hypothetical protein